MVSIRESLIDKMLLFNSVFTHLGDKASCGFQNLKFRSSPVYGADCPV